MPTFWIPSNDNFEEAMAEPSTVARPYAEAAFRLADEAGALAKWSEMLGALALVAADERVRAAAADPNLGEAQVAGLFIAILSGRLSGDAENFVRVLAQNGRLELLPEIRTQFEALKNEREGVLEAEVHSAFELSDAQVQELVQRLEKKTGRKVRTRVQVDKELIAGVRIVLGDKVIDGSARAQLGALETALKA
jgi:F-type H+-transporting ATPase subunit delta